MSESELDELAQKLAVALAEHMRAQQSTENAGACHLSESEQQAVRGLIRTKMHAVSAALFVIGAVVLWILKDVYVWVVTHLTLGWNR